MSFEPMTVDQARILPIRCQECGKSFPLAEWTHEKRWVAPLEAMGPPDRRREVETRGADALYCPPCGECLWPAAHPEKEALAHVLAKSDDELGQIFPQQWEAHADSLPLRYRRDANGRLGPPIYEVPAEHS